MRTIHKYIVRVGYREKIAMDSGAKIIHVEAFSPDQVTMWVELYPEPTRVVNRFFRVFGTSDAIDVAGNHCGTAVWNGGALVWHLYELTGIRAVYRDPQGVPI